PHPPSPPLPYTTLFRSHTPASAAFAKFGVCHRNRIGFFAGGTAQCPHAHRFVPRTFGSELGKHLALEQIVRFRIAEKTGDVDQRSEEHTSELQSPDHLV